MTKQHLVVSLDGGGLRGAYTAETLAQIQAEIPFLDDVFLFAGTSTGALLAAALAKGLSPNDIVRFFREKGPEIFTQRDWWDGMTELDELFRADYDNEILLESLAKVFGDDRICDLQKNVLISTFALCKDDGVCGAKYLHSWDAKDRLLSVSRALGRSTAAPTYFPSYERHIDGGMVGSNPSMSALAQTVDVLGREELGNIWVLSIGTGINPHKITGKSHDWGIKQWLSDKRLLNILLNGMIGVADYQCSKMLGSYSKQELPLGRYLRIDVNLDEEIDLDAVSKIGEMVAIAQGQDLQSAQDFLAQFHAANAA